MTNGQKYKTLEDRLYAFHRYCGTRNCGNCQVHKLPHDADGGVGCMNRWLALESEEEELLHCPFCKGATIIAEDYFNKPQRQVMCPLCGYRSPRNIDVSEAVRDHNKLVKLVLKLNGGENP